MKTTLIKQISYVLTSRRFKNIYILKNDRTNWNWNKIQTDLGELEFRFTGFGKNPNRHKAYVTANSKKVSTKFLQEYISHLRIS